MRWDPLLAEALARELHRTLGGARVRSLLLDTEERRVLLHLREGTLVLEMHPTRGWVSLLEPQEPPAAARPLPARVRGVRALPDESALVFSLQRIRGRDEGVELVAEFVANRWNALVVGYRSRQIRHVLLPREERDRVLKVGEAYEAPPGSGRAGARSAGGDGTMASGLSSEWWVRTVARRDRKTLLRSVAYTSSLNAPLFLEEGGVTEGAGTRPEVEGGRGEPEVRVLPGRDGFDRWERMRDPEHWAPLVLRTPRGPQPYPIPIPGTPGSPLPSLLEAFARAREESEGEGHAALLVPARLLARAEDRLKRLERKADALRRELEGARDPEPVRALGDLLLARYGEISRGSPRVTLRDFQGEEVEVELDPSLPPHENAKRYYDEAARLERVRKELPAKVEKAGAALEGWRRRLEGVRSGERPPSELEEALGPERPGGRGPGRGGDRGPSLPFRRYRSSGGLEIRVGRGARQNDDLTFHHSAPDDIWMHVREAPGPHVILRWNREDNPPSRDLAEAAVLAALGSEARHAGTVPVDWTRRKYVRKPRKAPPGAVVPQRVETVFVSPDPAVEKRLREEE